VLDAFVNDDRRGGGFRDTIWVVWVDGGKYMVNPRNDDIMYLTSSSHLKA
tara:strand:+ start:323 stop:472 length:150 start_codon:yes stop_codon:yes gene_type:complete